MGGSPDIDNADVQRVQDVSEQQQGRVVTPLADAPARGAALAPRGIDKDSPEIIRHEFGRSEAQNDEEIDLSGIDGQIRTLEDWLAANPPETKEQREKRERRERSKRVISAVTDGLAAMSNLFFTSQYAPNMYSHERQSAVRQTMGAIDRAKADRDRQQEQYMNFSLRLGDLKNRRGATVRELQDRAEKRKMAAAAEERARAAEERAKALEPFNLRKAEANAEGAEADAEYKRTQADRADEVIDATIGAKNRSGRGGGGAPGQFTVVRKNPETGKLEYRGGFRSEAAARNFAASHPQEEWMYVTTPTRKASYTEITDYKDGSKDTEMVTETDVSTPTGDGKKGKARRSPTADAVVKKSPTAN